MTDYMFLLMYDPKFLSMYLLAVLKEKMKKVADYLCLPGLLKG